jgi:transposase
MKKADARSLTSTAQEALRMRAIQAVLDGKSHAEVGRVMGVTRQTIGIWKKVYDEGGWEALKGRPRGRKPGKRLVPWQSAQVVRKIMDKTPDQLRLPFVLWTREAVGQWIEKRFGIQLSVWTVGRYLRAWDLTPQKPLRRAYEQDPKAVDRWLKQTYPTIRTRAKRCKALIYWADQMGMRSDHSAGRSWSLKGQTPVIPGTGQRFSCSMMSAITNQGHLAFMVFKRRFVARTCVNFLQRLIRQEKRRVFLIWDGHPVHKSSKLRKWLEAHRDRIETFMLPGYSPQLNPDEELNQDTKANAVGRQRPQTLPEMMGNVRSFLRSRQKQPHRIRRYFQEEHVRYAAA